MKPAAAIYTVASLAVLGLMIYTRTPVETTSPAQAAAPAQQEAASADAATSTESTQTDQQAAPTQEQAPAQQEAASADAAPSAESTQAEQQTPQQTAPTEQEQPPAQTAPAQQMATPTQPMMPTEAMNPTPQDIPTQQAPAQPAADDAAQQPATPLVQQGPASSRQPQATTQSNPATGTAQQPPPAAPASDSGTTTQSLTPAQDATPGTAAQQPPPPTAPTEATPGAGTPDTNPEEKKNDTTPVGSSKPTPTTSGSQPDYQREQRMDAEIRDMILDGEVVDLNDGSHNFIAILTEAEQPRGAAIILHGRGFHPDWQDVAHPLRTGLAEKGWTTLSLQMPVLEKEAKYYDYLPLFPNAGQRIDAGIAFLRQKGIAPIILIAHSCGAHMAMHWVANKGDTDIAAYVGLGMGATDYQQEMKEPFPLGKMQVPVLDIYGEKEYPQVIKMAPERLDLMQRAGNTHSRQMILPDANHYFTDKGSELNAVVTNWLNSLPF